jgi:hypothetical protein
VTLPGGGRPISISWSGLRAHEECRQKAHLLRTGKKSPSTNIRQFFHGTVVDRVMREWLEDEARQPDGMALLVEEIMDREELAAVNSGDGVVRWKNHRDRTDLIEWCKELVTRLEPHLNELVVPYEFESARRFRVPVQIPYLTGEPAWIYLAGEMDILTRDEQPRFHVWDLKGTADDNYWRKTIGQLVFYDLATNAAFGEYCQRAGLIQPMCKQQIVEIEITPQRRNELMQRIIRMAHDMWSHDTMPKESSSGCNYCPVHHACVKFQPVNPGQNEKRMSLVSMQQTSVGSTVTSMLALPTVQA